jgi:hypothetical protein
MGANFSAIFGRSTLTILVSFALADCSTLNRGHQPAPVAAKVIAPAEAQEIPLSKPVIDLPTSAPSPAAPQIASNVPTSRPKRPASQKPAVPQKDLAPLPLPEPEAVVPSELVGFDFPSVLHVLRNPDTVQNSALSVVWTYAQPDCMLQLYFYPDIQTKVFRLLKYDLKDSTGERPSDSTFCMRRIARTDEPAIP